jgi:DNA-binding response OmpR family regulator
MKPTRILIVDVDPAIRKFGKASLEASDYQVLLAVDGDEAIKTVEKELPDLIILDIMMPKKDGFEVCRTVRGWSAVPIIMLTARDSEEDKVKCFEYGADDYLTKPFLIRELLSRVKAVLRRSQPSENSSSLPVVRCGDLEIDLNRKRVILDGKDIKLTTTEYYIIAYLAANVGRVITFNQMLEKIWGDESIYNDYHLVQVNVARIRQKLGDNSRDPKYISTMSGIGYMLLKTKVQ